MGGKAHGGRRITRNEAHKVVGWFSESIVGVTDWEPVGSFRRETPENGDLDFLVLRDPTDADQERSCTLDHWLAHHFGMQANGKKPAHSGLVDGVQVEVYVCEDKQDWGSFRQMWTGSMQHNIVLRAKAKRKGWSLSQYGAKNVATGEHIHFPTEVQLYDFLGVNFVSPVDR